MLADKKWYYVTIEKIQRYNVTVQADSANEAEDVALESPFDEDIPDDIFTEVTSVEEVKRYVE